MPIGITLNNPGDLTVLKPGQLLYPGQSGTGQGNGLTYAQFPTADAGENALVDYVTRHIASGWTTLSQFVYGFLGTSTNNAANPHVQNYLNTVSQATGIAPNAVITSSEASAIAAGISKAEGTSSAFNFGAGASTVGGNSSPVNSNPLVTGWDNLETGTSNLINGSGAGIGGALGASLGATINGGAAIPMAPQGLVNQASAATSQAAATLAAPFTAISNQVTGIVNGFKAWEANTLPSAIERTAIGIVAIVLIIAGVFFLAGGPKIVTAAALAA
jgi:hypothetical protein